jgi:alpha-1,2-mannosyltransferase
VTASIPATSAPLRERPDRRARLLLVATVAVVASIYMSFGILTAAESLGYDYYVYSTAAERFLSGEPLYDTSITRTGVGNVYQYPPPFVAVAVPFALLGFDLGNAAWIAALLVCFVVGCAIIPVRWEVRLAIFLAGATGWPLIFGVRIGQVVPILFLLFAIGWRWLDRPGVVGAIAAFGALIKLQPVVLLGWLAAVGSWRGVAIGVGTGIAATAVAALVGLGQWADMLTLLRNLADATDVSANVSLGASAYALGVPQEVAGILQSISVVAVLGFVVLCARRSSREASYLVAVIASQIISPIVWTHYALILLLPVAWLLQRRQWWAVLIPLSQAWVLLPFMPLLAYPVAFYVALIGVPLVDRYWPRPSTVLLRPA